MKRASVYLFISAFFFFLFLASSNILIADIKKGEGISNKKIGEKNEDKPQIVFEKQVHDFGKNYIGEILRCRFKFKNKGSGELVIGSVKSSCGCTAALVSKNKLLKDEESEVDVTFNPGQRAGKITKSVIINSNDPNNPRYTLTITGEMIEEVNVNPKRINFGIIKKGDSSSKTLEIKTVPELKIEVKKVESPNSYIRIISNKINESNYNYQIILNNYDHIGKFTGIIFVYTTSNRQERIDIPFFGEIAGDLTFYPETLSFGNVRKGQNTKKTVIVNFLNNDVGIDKVEIIPNIMSYTVSDLNTSKRIDVRLHEDTTTGKFNGSIKIYTNSVIQPIVTIPIIGEIKE
jgi:hypothetical protein